MKHCIWIMICSLWISAYGAIEENSEKVIATLPEGISIELVGLRSYSAGNPQQTKDRSGPWWGPNGNQLIISPDKRFDCCSWADSYLFIISIKDGVNCTFKAVGPWDNDLTVESARETDKGQELENMDIRRFTLRYGGQKSADVKLGVATGNWDILENWPFSSNGTPYDFFYTSSNGAIMRCPEQKGTDIIAEVTQLITDRVTRLVVFDRNGKQYVSYGNEGGKSNNLVRYIHYFRNLRKDAIDHLEFQSRPYDYWITFSNVSLQMGQKTQVQIKIEKPGYLLPGQPLPNFDGIKFDLSNTPTKNRRLIVCFFDYQQRPSRNCILQLSKRAQELKEKDTAIVAVQASKIEQTKLDEWIRGNNIPFPIGIVEADIEKIRYNWGIKSLPWLILADKQNIVRAEGFGGKDLDEKIKQCKEE